ncbi:LysM peptidoglycan-binding domain-containing protein [Luteolibacter marinus]|uniref:LysM peptidoglycan-binding domain-containing protein n=1 Tax=Luteolibacter marinus TaxID=2776705 RepID=UPI0018682A0A|nr:LysM domain-containing protein [Luteolibacter marinus]
MRVLPFLAALACTAPFANAKTELELLQDRCSEQERQIRQLELENSQLKSLVETASKTPAPREHVEATETPAASSGPAYGIVRSGDNISKLAKRHGTTSATLIKLNNLSNPSLIRPGQKLRLPDKAAPAKAAPAKRSGQGTHVVKSGETFYSIARHYGLSPQTLQAANPSTKAESLRPGQTLVLGGKSPAVAETKPAPAPPAPKASASKPAAPEVAESTSQTVASTPRIKLISITENTDFGAFAAAHGTSTAKLNALNGLNLNSSTVLAKGSELHVPAQP